MSNQITPNPSVPSQVVQEVKFPKFVNNLGIIPTSYKDSMSYYETLTWLCKYLEETVIPTLNENGKAVEELQGLYVELNSYVTNYFDNLDVQEEINNKLDEMTEAGTLEEIISVYLNSRATFGYNNVNEMKNAENLQNGSYAYTLGFYESGDGGEATYQIVTKTNEDVVDNMFIIQMTDPTLIAKLCYNEHFINIKSLGAKGDGIQDETSIIQSAINKITSGTIEIPEGTYKLTRTDSFITTDYGNYTSKYSLILEDKSNIKITGTGTLIPDETIENFNCITFKNSNNCVVENISGNYDDDPNSDISILQTKFLVFIYLSNNITCKNLTSKNIGGCVCVTSSSNCNVYNCKASRDDTDYKAPSLFGTYKSKNTKFDSCLCYGSCEDGDIAIFGSSEKCEIINSKIFNSYEETPNDILLDTNQGYCVDSGCLHSSVINNYAYGYYYGIDVKTNCENTIISNNHLVKNKIGISSRVGEGNAINYDTNIINNVISVNNGNGNTVTKIDDYYNYGIYIEHSEGINVSNNLVGNDTVANGYTNPFVGIGINYSNAINIANEKINIMCNNIINMETRKGTQFAYSNAPAIYLHGEDATHPIKNWNVKNNTIKPHYAQSLTFYDLIVEYGDKIMLEGNIFTDKPNSIGSIDVNNSKNMLIYNNYFSQSNKNLRIRNSNDVKVSGNRFTSPRKYK